MPTGATNAINWHAEAHLIEHIPPARARNSNYAYIHAHDQVPHKEPPVDYALLHPAHHQTYEVSVDVRRAWCLGT